MSRANRAGHAGRAGRTGWAGPAGRAGRAAAIGVGLALLALCGWFEAALPPFHAGSSVLLFSVAAAVLATGAVAARSARGRAPASGAGGSTARDLSVPGTIAWLSAGLFALAVELWEFAHSPRPSFPTLSSLANDVVGPGHRIARTAAFVCWGAAGLVVASRARRRE